MLNQGSLQRSEENVEAILRDLRTANTDAHLRRRTEGDARVFSRDSDVEVSKWLTSVNRLHDVLPDDV
jgi:hypothetical protein